MSIRIVSTGAFQSHALHVCFYGLFYFLMLLHLSQIETLATRTEDISLSGQRLNKNRELRSQVCMIGNLVMQQGLCDRSSRKTNSWTECFLNAYLRVI